MFVVILKTVHRCTVVARRLFKIPYIAKHLWTPDQNADMRLLDIPLCSDLRVTLQGLLLRG